MALRRVALGVILAVAVSVAGANQVFAGQSLKPVKGARAAFPSAGIAATVDLQGAQRLRGLVPKGTNYWPAQGGAGELGLQLPADLKKGTFMVVVQTSAKDSHQVVVEGSKKPKGGGWQSLGTYSGTKEGMHHRATVTPGHRRLRIRLEGDGAQLTSLRIYRLDPRGRNDYWLFVGASIMSAGLDETAFAQKIAGRHRGYDPYVVNEAVSGWTSAKLKKELPTILKRHRHARYVGIHMGGNDISLKRPYPGGANTLHANLKAILTMIQEEGKIPILARQSFRAYKAKGDKPAVPPESNGSGPYVTKIYDPLIAEYCPWFFDRRKKRGVVDLYSYYQDHQNELGGDGVHLTKTGYTSWTRLWSEMAGDVVYTR